MKLLSLIAIIALLIPCNVIAQSPSDEEIDAAYKLCEPKRPLRLKSLRPPWPAGYERCEAIEEVWAHSKPARDRAAAEAKAKADQAAIDALADRLK